MLPTGMEEKKEITGYSMTVSFSESRSTWKQRNAAHGDGRKERDNGLQYDSIL
jgi:hypothetical protein